jgi:hypothetical protein
LKRFVHRQRRQLGPLVRIEENSQKVIVCVEDLHEIASCPVTNNTSASASSGVKASAEALPSDVALLRHQSNPGQVSVRVDRLE